MEEPQEGVERAEGIDAPEEAPEGHEAPQEAPESTIVDEPPSVFEALGEQYEEAQGDRRETFPILPGRFKGNLAVRVRPIDAKKRKKRARRIAKRGINEEIEANWAAMTIAEACEAILVRMADGEDYIEAQKVPGAGLGDESVRFDKRLGQIVPSLGAILQGNESEAQIVRLLFRNIEALEAFYVDLDLWLKEALPSDGDEDEEDGADRPT